MKEKTPEGPSRKMPATLKEFLLSLLREIVSKRRWLLIPLWILLLLIGILLLLFGSSSLLPAIYIAI